MSATTTAAVKPSDPAPAANPDGTAAAAPEGVSAPSADTKPAASWTEEDYLSALNHITQLQSLVSSLRDTIPSLTRPLASFQPSRQQQTAQQQQQRPPALHRVRAGGISPRPTAEEARKRRAVALGALRSAAVKGNGGIKDLRALWESPRTQEVFGRLAQSRGEDADLKGGMGGKVDGEGDSRGW